MLMLCEDSSSTFGMRSYFKSFSTDQDVPSYPKVCVPESVKIESLAELTESAGPADSAGRRPADQSNEVQILYSAQIFCLLNSLK